MGAISCSLRLPAAVLAVACLTWRPAKAALNVDQVLEEAILGLRERVFVAHALVSQASSSRCDSVTEGPHCSRQAALAAGTSEGGSASSDASALRAQSSALVDGFFSSRLLSSPDGGEMLDAYVIGEGLKAARRETRPEDQGSVSSGSRERRKAFRGSHGRSALLSFKGLEPWLNSFPFDFAGARRFGGGIPFKVEWQGPWHLVENPLLDSYVQKKGHFVAQLQGTVGRISFGRAVHLQTVDLARPMRSDCLAESITPASSSRSSFPRRPPSPLVIKGRREGREVFNELIPNWELRSFVNGVAFFALTDTQPIDEVVFLLAECTLVAAIQISFGSGLEQDASGGAAETQAASAVEPPMLLAMREGWHAYGWEEVELRLPSSVGDAPVWSLNEVVQNRLELRKGVFDVPLKSPADADEPGLSDAAVAEQLEKQEEEQLMSGQPASKTQKNPSATAKQGGVHLSETGPETISMPQGLEEVLDAQPQLQEPLDSAIGWQRNASVLLSLTQDLLYSTSDAVAQSMTIAGAEAWGAFAAVDVPRGAIKGEAESVHVAQEPDTAQSMRSDSFKLAGDVDAELLRGLTRRALNADLAKLARALVEAAEGNNKALVTAISAGEAVDTIWRGLSLDSLDSLLFRWESWRHYEDQEQLEMEERQDLGAGSGTEALPPNGLDVGLDLSENQLESLQRLEEPLMAAAAVEEEPLPELKDLMSKLQQRQSALEQGLADQPQAAGALQDAQSLEDAESHEAVKQLAAQVPGAALTERLVSLVQSAEEIIRLRVKKRRPHFQVTTQLPASAFGGGDEKYEVTIQAVDQEGSVSKEVHISIRDSSGRQVTPMQTLPMASAEQLLQAFGASETVSAQLASAGDATTSEESPKGEA